MFDALLLHFEISHQHEIKNATSSKKKKINFLRSESCSCSIIHTKSCGISQVHLSVRIPFLLLKVGRCVNKRSTFVSFSIKPFEQEYDLAAYSLLTSLALDFIDGPLARRFDMCSQFGDLNDHVCDHLTMIAAVYFTTDTTQWFGCVNMIVNIVHCLAAIIYMAKFGHYFKHSKSGRNIIMDVIESNNYWNIASVLWGCNYMAVPLIKLSYASSHGLSPTESTGFVNICDFLGMCVAASYTVAVWY